MQGLGSKLPSCPDSGLEFGVVGFSDPGFGLGSGFRHLQRVLRFSMQGSGSGSRGFARAAICRATVPSCTGFYGFRLMLHPSVRGREGRIQVHWPFGVGLISE